MMQTMQQRAGDGSRVYARATPRLRALMRDLLVQFVIVVLLIVPATVQNNPDLLRILAPVCILAFVFYEPVLIALRGATLGHSAMNLRIVRAGDFGRVSFPRALLRTFVKWIFGLPSFIAMYFTAKHQAIHDLASGTVVVPSDPFRARPEWFDPARAEAAVFVLPGRARRALVILAHWLVWYVLFIAALVVIVPADCVDEWRICRPFVRQLIAVSSLIWVAGLIVLGFAGWTGTLWGAQRQPAPVDGESIS